MWLVSKQKEDLLKIAIENIKEWDTFRSEVVWMIVRIVGERLGRTMEFVTEMEAKIGPEELCIKALVGLKKVRSRHTWERLDPVQMATELIDDILISIADQQSMFRMEPDSIERYD
jgi:hypothetical protein